MHISELPISRYTLSILSSGIGEKAKNNQFFFNHCGHFRNSFRLRELTIPTPTYLPLRGGDIKALEGIGGERWEGLTIYSRVREKRPPFYNNYCYNCYNYCYNCYNSTEKS